MAVSPVGTPSIQFSASIFFFEFVPDEVIRLIFSLLKARDVLACALVCRRWRHLSEDRQVWLAVFERGPLPVKKRNEAWYHRCNMSLEPLAFKMLIRELGESKRFNLALAAAEAMAKKYPEEFAISSILVELFAIATEANQSDAALSCHGLSKKFQSRA